MDGPEWAAGKLSEDHKDNRWSLLSADLRELEQQIAEHEQLIQDMPNMCWAKQIEQQIASLTVHVASHLLAGAAMEKRIDYLEKVCEQCILEHQGRSI